MLIRLVLPLFLAAFCHTAFSQDFSLITWNMGEISDPNPKRIGRLLNVALSLQPDILLFQEVEGLSWDQIRHHPTVETNYRVVYQPSRTEIPRGGVVTLLRSRLKVGVPRYQDLPSDMERGVLLLPVSVCHSWVVLANVHLESPDLLFWRSRSHRHQQLRVIQEMASDSESWIVGGDFNPVFESGPAQRLPDTWMDAWIQLNPDEPGFTWNPESNEMAWRQGGFILPAYRLDRVMYQTSGLVPNKAQILGVGEIEPLSDHYGLRVDFSCQKLG